MKLNWFPQPGICFGYTFITMTNSSDWLCWRVPQERGLQGVPQEVRWVGWTWIYMMQVEWRHIRPRPRVLQVPDVLGMSKQAKHIQDLCWDLEEEKPIIMAFFTESAPRPIWSISCNICLLSPPRNPNCIKETHHDGIFHWICPYANSVYKSHCQTFLNKLKFRWGTLASTLRWGSNTVLSGDHRPNHNFIIINIVYINILITFI